MVETLTMTLKTEVIDYGQGHTLAFINVVIIWGVFFFTFWTAVVLAREIGKNTIYLFSNMIRKKPRTL